VRTLHALVCSLILAAALTSANAASAATAEAEEGVSSTPMVATAYCDRGPTKSGVLAQPGVVAADIRHLPLGTRVHVETPGQPYAGVYTVLDTGSKIKGRKLDIFISSCSRAKRFGKRLVHVRILKVGP
jgi:3D (Asp-Asp-Asp) domain-containing protein